MELRRLFFTSKGRSVYGTFKAPPLVYCHAKPPVASGINARHFASENSDRQPVEVDRKSSKSTRPNNDAVADTHPKSNNAPVKLGRSSSSNASLIVQKRMNALLAHALATFDSLGGQINHVTGYDEIEALKKEVKANEDAIVALQSASRAAKRTYEEAVSQRSACQREVNDLLQRKSSWNEEDVSRFTALVRQDHLNEQAEIRAKDESTRAEGEVERGQTELMQSILHRYHEEQVWSDKIRSASTYGSLVALGLNMIVFILAVVAVEPWKRKKLVQTFQARVEEMSSEHQKTVELGIGELKQRLEMQDALLLRLSREVIPFGTLSMAPQPLAEKDGEQQCLQKADGVVEAEKGNVTALRRKAASLWVQMRTKVTQQPEVLLVGLGGAAVGVITTGCLSVILWSARK